MEISGRIVFEDIEGGVWGIEDDNGKKYHPVDGLPEGLKVAGQRVRAKVEPASVLTTAMWGRSVRITDIEKAG